MEHSFIKLYKNVKIRPLCMEDLDYLRKWRNDPNNTKFLSKIPYITAEMQEEWYKSTLKVEGEYVFAIEEIIELNRIVGSLALYNIANGCAEFGKILIGDEHAHGKKLGLNSLKAALSICFFELNLDEVYLHVYKDNEVAKYIYEKAGFCISDKKNTSFGEELRMVIKKSKFINQGEKNETQYE